MIRHHWPRTDVLQASATDRAKVAAVARCLVAPYQETGLQVAVLEPVPRRGGHGRGRAGILSNLLDNARQHGDDAVTVAVTCPVPDSRADATLLIEISDNDPGSRLGKALRYPTVIEDIRHPSFNRPTNHLKTSL